MKFIKRITQTQLFTISALNSWSVIVKIGVGLITSKLLAVSVGPSGIALVGNLRNFITSLETISTLGFQNGIVKYIAENENDRKNIQKIITTVFISLFFVAIILSIILFFFAEDWSQYVFGNHVDYSYVFKVTALALPWYTISVFLLAVLNGLGLFKKVIWIAIMGNLMSLVISILLILHYKTLGALISVVITPALLFLLTSHFINKEICFLDMIRFQLFDFQILKNLSSYSLMALVSSVLGPLLFLAIRNNVIDDLGLEQAGYWETMTRISTYYMVFVTTILSVYFYPKLANAKSNAATKIIFWSYYKSILPVFIVGLIVIYFLRFFIIEWLFTKAFLPVAPLFFWQLIGDIFKVAFLILGFQFFAKKMTLAFIIFELFSLFVLYIASRYFINWFGIQGVVMAQAFDNFIYLTILLLYFRRSLV